MTTRKTLTVKVETYQKLRVFCDRTNRSISKVVEGLLAPLLDDSKENETTRHVLEEVLNGSRLEQRHTIADFVAAAAGRK